MNPGESTLLTVKEISSRLRVSPDTIYRAVRMGQLPALRVLGSIRFNLNDVERAIAINRMPLERPETHADRVRRARAVLGVEER